MKFIAIAAVAALITTPTMAATNSNFVGPRIAVTAGVDDVTGARDFNDVTYGAELGVDAPLGDRVVIGVQADAGNVFERTRTIGVTGRVGYAFNGNVLGYATAGYANYRNIRLNRSQYLDGARVGAGLELSFNKNVFAKAEYRYTDFSQGVGNHSGLVGFGIRF